MAEALDLAPRGAFDPAATIRAGGVTITARAGLGLASVAALRGRGAALAQAIRAAWGLDAPDGPACAAAGGLALVGVGPDAWLAIGEDPAGDWPAVLVARLGGLAAVADQSGAYGVARLEGPAVRDLLARGVFLDLDPATFPVGSAAVSSLGHFGCILWRLDGPDRFEIAVPRGVAADVWRWLDHTAAALP